MRKSKVLTVENFLTIRDKSTYGKQVRILNNATHKNCGEWWENANKAVKAVKITEKYLFVFI